MSVDSMSFELRRQVASYLRGKKNQMRSGSSLFDLLQVNEGLPLLVVRIKLSKDESLIKVTLVFETLKGALVSRFIAPEVSNGVLGKAEER